MTTVLFACVHNAGRSQMAAAWFNALAQRGREATIALERYDQRLEVGLEAWFGIKPKRAGDLRKLLGAVLLIAPRPRP